MVAEPIPCGGSSERIVSCRGGLGWPQAEAEVATGEWPGLTAERSGPAAGTTTRRRRAQNASPGREYICIPTPLYLHNSTLQICIDTPSCYPYMAGIIASRAPIGGHCPSAPPPYIRCAEGSLAPVR